ncbi:unnamed protein product [Cuscuta epithymum]|uniref:Uncharacterized protein n=1 Tax=Cuscuta epithymum TaxID=186058 RepID=A0AAV0FTS2_9ASTE|nr:unnamed protein product [Cuscuta epithymum]
MKALVKGISSDFTKLEKSPELSPELTKSRRSFTGVQPRRVELHNASSRYLQGSISHGLLFRPSTTTPTIQAYSDADWAGCPDSSRSTSGFAIFLGPNLVS